MSQRPTLHLHDVLTRINLLYQKRKRKTYSRSKQSKKQTKDQKEITLEIEIQTTAEHRREAVQAWDMICPSCHGTHLKIC